MGEQCGICLEYLDQHRDEHTLACGHRFHSACLLPWVLNQNNSCPSCRTAMNGDAGPRPPSMLLYARASYLRGTVARRRNAPRELVALVSRVRTAEEAYRNSARETLEYNRSHSTVMAALRRLRVRRWSAAAKVRRLKHLLGMFACRDYPLPELRVFT